MTYRITVLRQEMGSEEKYRQSFAYESLTDHDTVATALTALNERTPLTDADGSEARRIEWECSCLQKKCGACAMVINGRPGLACDAVLKDIVPGGRASRSRKTGVQTDGQTGAAEIVLEPLKKFPCVSDLTVDRSIMRANLMTMKAWLSADSELADKYIDLAYEGSECIQCGCCLEICPNFYAGGRFYGMAVTPLTTRLLMEQDKADYKKTAKEYAAHLYEGCGKSLACKDICPRHIDTERLMVNSNALAVWHRRKR